MVPASRGMRSCTRSGLVFVGRNGRATVLYSLLGEGRDRADLGVVCRGANMCCQLRSTYPERKTIAGLPCWVSTAYCSIFELVCL